MVVKVVLGVVVAAAAIVALWLLVVFFLLGDDANAHAQTLAGLTGRALG